MADLSKTIDIVLNGQDKASKELNQVSGSLGNLSKKFGSMAKVGAQAATALAAVGAGVTALVGAGLKQAYDESVNLESAMTDLEKVLGDQPDLLDQAKQSALELSNTYGLAASDITDSITGWVQAGYDLEDATKLAESSIKLMISSELDAAQSTETLTKLVKGYGLSVEETESKLDAINSVTQKFATNTGDLSEALSVVGPIADSMGISMEQMSALVTPVIEKFQDGKQAGTAFKTILANMINPTGQAAEAMKELGLYQDVVNGEFDSGQEIVDAVINKFQSLDENQQTLIATQIAGKEHFSKFIGAFSDAEKNTAIYNTAMDKAATITEEVRAQLESSENIIKVHQKSWDNLAGVIGDKYNESVDEVIKGSALISGALQDSINEGDFDEIFDVINQVFEDLSEQLKGIAEALPEAMDDVDWTEFSEAIQGLADSFSGLFDDLDLTKPDELAEAIQEIVDLGSNFIDFFGNVIKVTEPFVSAIVTAVEYVNELADVIKNIDGPVDVFKGVMVVAIDVLETFVKALDYIPGLDMSDAIADMETFKDVIIDSTKETEKGAEAAEKIKEKVEEIPDKKKAKVEVEDDGKAEKVKKDIDNIPDQKNVGIAIKEGDSVQDILAKIEGEQDVDVNVDDKGTADKTAKEIEDKIPAEKKLELETDLKMAQLEKDIAQIETQGKLAQTAMEWTAKVDIKDAEYSMEKFKSAIGSVNTGIESTENVLGDLFGLLGDASTDPNIWASDVEQWIEKEYKLREQEFEQQKKLIQEQIKMMQAKREAIEDGEGLITIQGEGLAPELEAFMWAVIQRVQVRANEEASEFLLGINS